MIIIPKSIKRIILIGCALSCSNFAFSQSPGGVNTNLKLWLKAGTGVTGTTNVSAWADQSGLGNNAVQATPANQPALVTNDLNFNPTVNFYGSTSLMTLTTPPADLNSTVFTVAIPTVNSNWRTMFRGTAGHHPLIVQSGGTALGFYDNITGGFKTSGFTWLQNEPAVVGLEMYSGDVNFRKNGAQGGSINTINLSTFSLNNFGNYQSFTQNFGRIAETIIYNSPTALTLNEKNKIESYLAVKYGVTLSHDYVATNNAIVWDATANAAYANNIVGVGRDDNTTLDQRKSRSIVAGTVLTLEKSTPASGFAGDLNIFIAGNDGAALAPTTVGVPTGFPVFPMRVTRIWKAQVTGTPGTMSVSFDLGTGIYNSGIASDYSILISNTADFSAATPVIGGSIAGTTITFSGISISNGNFFTLGLPLVPSPGGVIAGLSVWLKADKGVSADAAGTVPATDLGPVQQWNDQTTFSNNATSTGTPVFNKTTNLINYNPTVYYDGASGHNLNYAAVNQNSLITISRMEGTQNRRAFSTRIGNTLLGYWNGKEDVFYLNGNPSILGGQPATTNPNMYAQTQSLSGAWLFNKNGLTLGSGATSTASTIQLGIANGGTYSGEPSKQFVSEVVQYDHDITPTELNKVQSYLAVKYGISLDQTTPANYVASDGTVIWNATTNAAYHSNITGVGRDDGSGLSQQKSKSVNVRSPVIIDKGGAFATNKNFIVFGDDNALLTPTKTGAHPTYPYRITRVWRSQLSGTPGAVNVSFDLSIGIYNSGVAANYALLIKNTDTNFSTGAVAYTTGASITGSILTFTGVNFADGDYFTLAMPNVSSPGGVVNNLQLWLKGNQGVTGGATASAWNDQSGNGFNVIQPTVANQPAVQSNSINFNTALQFNGATTSLTLANGILGTVAYNDVNMFVVSRANTIANSSIFFESTPGGQFNGHMPWGNSNIYWDAGNTGTNRLNVNWLANVSIPYMWSLNSSTTGTVSGSLQDIYKNAQRIASDFTMNSFTGNNSTLFIGSGANTNFYNGDISEILMYSGPLTSAQQQQIQSYLALKYGVTMNQPTPQNYLSSNGSVIFHATTTHASYSKDIAGIGRDDNSALDQRKSKSINVPADIFALANGNFAAPTSFTTDQQFLVWGNNGFPLMSDAASALTQNGVPIAKQLSRVWSTDKNAALSGNAVIEFNMSTIAGPSGAGTNTNADVRMLIDGDGNFGNSSAGELTLVPDAGFAATGGTIYFTVPFNNIPAGQGYITIGSVNAVTCPLGAPTPGGVAAPIKLWLNANTGITGGANVASWADISGNGFVAAQATAGSQPAVITNRANFNTAVQFNGVNNTLVVPGGILGVSAYTDFSIFQISRVNTVVASQSFQESVFGGQLAGYTPWSDNNIYWDAGNSAVNRLNVNWGGTINTPYMWTLAASTTATISGALQDIYRNGRRIATDNTMGLFSGSGSNFNLGSGNGGVFFNGEISEFIVYSATLTAVQQQRVQSYLGIKYGITLDQTVPTSYLSSLGTVFWNSATNASHAGDIVGIGRDDGSALDQRKSKSINAGTVLTIEKSTPASAFATNLNFLVAGNDGGSLGATTIGVPTGFPVYPMRVTRTWRTQVTGAPGTVTITFDLGTGIYNSGVATDYSLLVGASNNFSAVTPITGGVLAGNAITFSNITLADGNYFTLALPLIASPGGVITGLRVWLKANAGVSSDAAGVVPATDLGVVQQWDDQTSLANNATSTGTPIFNTTTNLINFNPTVYYDGASGHNLNYSAVNQNSVITVARMEGTQNRRVFSSRIGNTILGYWNNREDVFYLNANPSLLGGQAATVNPRMYGQTLATSGSWVFNRNGLILGSGATSAPTTIQLGIANGGSSGGEASKVYVSEVIQYDHDITLAEMNKVESYLAIKYGITLDQTTPANYVASDGTVIWNATTNVAYKNNIAGIGRDDAAALDQRKSKSVNAKSIVEIGGGAFASNKNFILWANDVSSTAATTAGAFPGFPYRTSRTWKTAVTGTPGVVTISFDLSQGIYNSGSASNYELILKSTDINFSTGATGIAGTLVGSILTFTGVTLVDGGFFSLAIANIPAPGGVVPNIQLWVKADAGVIGTTNVSPWIDQSGTGDDAVQSVLAQEPSLVPADINYNPSINFSGASTVLTLAAPPTNLNSTIFTVAVPTINTNWRTMFRGTVNDHPLIVQQTGTTLGYYDGDNVGFKSSGFTWLQNEVAAVELEMYAGNVSFRKNGVQGANINSINLAGLNLDYFGNHSGLGQNFGRIAETVIYNSVTALTTVQKNRIETYLALKYGVTLSHDYLASDATVIWNSTTNAAYNRDVTGVGRDDNSALNQKQSASVNAGNILSISNGTGALAVDNASNGNNFGTDKSFFVWGHNNLAIAGLNVTDFGTTTNAEVMKTRIARAWKATETGTVGTLHLRFDLSLVKGVGGTPGNNDLNKVRLLVDADGVFATGALSVAPNTFNNGTGIVEFEFDFVPGTGFFFSIGSTDLTTAPLPVELVSFSAKAQEEYVDVTWITASELNNDYFVVQTSVDLEAWSDVSRVKGHGTTSAKNVYEMKDFAPFVGTSYYRLTQTDFDGTKKVSDVRAVDFKGTGIKLYPNPTVKRHTRLEVPSASSSVLISISNLMAQEVYRKVLVGSGGETLIAELELDNLSSGEYFVRIINGTTAVYRKLIID